MSQFRQLPPGMVVPGRGRTALAERRPCVGALRGVVAGCIMLAAGDRPRRVEHLPYRALSEFGMRVYPSGENDGRRALR